MASVNKITLIGHCGRDPETRTFPSGGQVCNVSIATSERWRDKTSGEVREHTEWHNLVFADRLAEIADQYVRKGFQIYVEGQLRSRKYQDRDGAERTAYEVRVRELKLLGGRESAPSRAPTPATRPASRQPAQAPAQHSGGASGFDHMDDDIPF